MHIVNKKVKVIFFFFLLLFLPLEITSHPHVFITGNITLEFNSTGFRGFWVNWSFDEFFSSMISNDYDKNRNGLFDRNEQSAIYKGAFINLKDFNYFTTISLKNEPYIVRNVERFKATLKKGKMGYTFFIPIKKDVNEITISQYDNTYYTDINLSSKIATKNGGKYTIKSTMYENKRKSFYNGMVHPYEIKIKIKGKILS
jgi:ABC-type uncharacterized transport system substrate-binding protein